MNKEKSERQFKGVWIPAEIWTDSELTLNEKAILTEIDSFSGVEGCFASNKHFAEFIDLSPNRCSTIITGLKDKGKITIDYTYQPGTKKIAKRFLRTVNSYSDRTPSTYGSTPSTYGSTPSVNGKTPSGNSKGTNTSNTNTSNTIKDKDPSSEFADKSESIKKKKYGEFMNVLLSDEELENLKRNHTDWTKRIEDLSIYIGSSGKSYKSHYLTILSWIRRDSQKSSTIGNSKTNVNIRHEVKMPEYSKSEIDDPDELKKLREEFEMKLAGGE